MLGSTTRAGLAPRLFTPKNAALPRTPYSRGVFAERGAFKGIWIGRVVHLGPRSGAAAAFVAGSTATNQHNSPQCGRVLLTCRRPGRASGAGAASCPFREFGTSRVWAWA